jgi:hypothetical protein
MKGSVNQEKQNFIKQGGSRADKSFVGSSWCQAEKERRKKGHKRIL